MSPGSFSKHAMFLKKVYCSSGYTQFISCTCIKNYITVRTETFLLDLCRHKFSVPDPWIFSVPAGPIVGLGTGKLCPPPHESRIIQSREIPCFDKAEVFPALSHKAEYRTCRMWNFDKPALV